MSKRSKNRHKKRKPGIYCGETMTEVSTLTDRRRTIGIAVSAFGIGVLLAFLVPRPILAVTEAAVIICAGALFIKN